MIQKFISYLIISFLCSSIGFAQSNLIVPYPTTITTQKGFFNINKYTSIKTNNHILQANIVPYLSKKLQQITGSILASSKIPSPNSNTINLILTTNKAAQKEAYNLTITPTNITIKSSTENGIFYGIQSLLQLLPTTQALPIQINQVNVTDNPRFSYRGMHLDVSRHFFTVPQVKAYIDLLAMHKYNTFHWHLTDDQGWRIEIKKYPLLTQIGSCRAQTLVGNYGSNQYDNTPYCGYYTQAQIKEVVAYAKQQYITIIPEIEMPGHALAALASYPYLGCTKGPYKTLQTWGVADDVFCAGNDSTYVFLKNVLEEIIPLFPGSYVHIGGDECPKERWKTCPTCQQKMKQQSLKNEQQLQSYFVHNMEQYINSKGKKIIGWDEILEGGLTPNATVMSWRGTEGGIAAAKQGNNVIMTPGSNCYFDHAQSNNEDSLTIGGYLPLQTVYDYEPIPAALTSTQATHILGAQGNIWTEYITNPKKLYYMALPRVAALAEVLWSSKANKNYDRFTQHLPTLFSRYTALGYNYSKAIYQLKSTVLPNKNNNAVVWQVQAPIGENYTIKTTLPTPTLVPQYNQEGEQIGQKNYYIDTVITYSVKPIANFLNIPINQNTIAKAQLYNSFFKHGYQVIADTQAISTITQQFYINKATGKKITLANAPNEAYTANGTFTLVDGIQNTRGMAKSGEFLGFLGTDMVATINFEQPTIINNVQIYYFTQPNSWIYPPLANSITLQVSNNGSTFTPVQGQIFTNDGNNNVAYTIQLPNNQTTATQIKLTAKNAGIIPNNNPGAGNPAWLFVSEIAVY